jgi:hypothetical protein
MNIFESIKFWWRVKKYNRKLLKQAREADRTPYETTKEDVDEWFEKNPFNITREELRVRKIKYFTEKVPVHTFKDIRL